MNAATTLTLNPALTAAQLKKIAKRYNLTLTGDGRRKGVKQQWIAQIEQAMKDDEASRQAPRYIYNLVTKTGNFTPEAGEAMAWKVWEVAHNTERNATEQAIANWFYGLVSAA